MKAIKRSFLLLLPLVLISMGLVFLLKTKTSIKKQDSKLSAIPKWDQDYFGPRRAAKLPYLTYLYNQTELEKVHKHLSMEVDKHVFTSLSDIDYVTSDADAAGLFVVILSRFARNNKFLNRNVLQKLPYWNSGRGHVIICLQTEADDIDVIEVLSVEQAIVAQSTFLAKNYRVSQHVITPPYAKSSNVDAISNFPPLLPVRRRHLIYFSGRPENGGKRFVQLCNSNAAIFCRDPAKGVNPTKTPLEPRSGEYNLHFTCSDHYNKSSFSEWQLCSNATERRVMLSDSTFTLLPSDLSEKSSVSFQIRLAEALKYGSVPVVIGNTPYPPLPYDEILDWRKALLFVPWHVSRANMIHILKNLNDSDIFEMRRYGRIMWTQYFSSTRAILETTLLVVRMRHFVPSAPARDHVTTAGANEINKTVLMDVEGFQNYKIKYEDFLRPGDPFHRYPSSLMRRHRKPRSSENVTGVCMVYKGRKRNRVVMVVNIF